MTEPNMDAKVTTSAGVQFITLADKAWPIPKLGPRQNRICMPLMRKLFREHTVLAKVKVDGVDKELVQFDMTTEVFDMMIDIVWVALTKAHATLTKEEFLDMPVSTPEIRDSMFIIAEQCGLSQRKKEEAPPSGEATAENPTGTD